MPILQPTHTIIDILCAAIESAQAEILLQAYYIDNDDICSRIAKKLIEKSRAGVSVYCLFDALGSRGICGSALEQELLDAGIHIQYFNWLTPWSGKNKKMWFFRNHKRLLSIDGKTIHTGGWCIGERTQSWFEGYICSDDTETVLQGVEDFWNMYRYAHKAQLHFTVEKKYTFQETKAISYAYQAPLLRSRYVYQTHRTLIQKATKKIVLIAPYFAPTHNLIRDIRKAKKRGVIVELYLPKKTDICIVDLVARTYMHNLLLLGVSIYMSETMIHAKLGLFDGVLYVGSMNLDPVSLRYNFENGIYTKDIATVQEFETDVEVLRKTCEKLSLEGWKNRTVWQKFLDEFMKMFRAFV